MPDHVARRVFETFFTTKGEKGTGIGVPQVRAFMHHIGGHTTVTSELGRGTTVDLFFPAIKPGDRPSSADCPDASAALSAASADNAVGLVTSHSNHCVRLVLRAEERRGGKGGVSRWRYGVW